MEFTHEVKGDCILIHVTGNNLDASRSYEFKDQIKELLEALNIYRLVIDLSDIEFIDSSGLGCLIASLRLAHSQNGDVCLCGLKRQVRSVFELVSLDKIFQSYDTAEEALQSMNTPV